MSRAGWMLVAVLAAALVVVVTLSAGGAGLIYFVLYALALAPGLPLGFLLFGRRHVAGWIAGAALGYFITSLGLWLAITARIPSVAAFVAAWVAPLVILWLVYRASKGPVVSLPAWTARDTQALLLTLLLVPAIAGPPFARLGATDAAGNRYYRAYFTADFVWHMAVTAELKKFAMPPRNMFMPQRPLQYYWSYYVLPAAIAGTGPRALTSVENDLKVNAIGTAMLLVSAMFLAAWAAVPRAAAVAGAVALGVVASSAEGIVEICRLLRRGAPLAALRDVNIDAISNWRFGGLRVDGLQRCFWWVPQHSMAYVLGLVALAIINATGTSASIAVYWVAGIALAGSVAFNPFVGAVFSFVWGIAALIDAAFAPDRIRRIARCSVAAIPVVLALAWCAGNRMVGGATGILEIGLFGNARHRPLFNLALSLGPVIATIIVGFVATRHSTRPRALLTATVMIATSLVVMHFVRLSVDDSWVGFRGGQMFLVAAPAVIAAGLSAPGVWRRIAVTVAIAALLAGLPTTIIDVYNAQDITNLSPGPGFPWTQVLDRPHADALEWLRRSTSLTDTVQVDAVARGQTTWTPIPSFAERRMAASLPRTLVDDPDYHERSEQVRQMYATTESRDAWTLARRLRVNYVWIDEVERGAYPAGVRKFDTAPEYFAPVYQNGVVSIYRVQ
jgi:hypothetical protein